MTQSYLVWFKFYCAKQGFFLTLPIHLALSYEAQDSSWSYKLGVHHFCAKQCKSAWGAITLRNMWECSVLSDAQNGLKPERETMDTLFNNINCLLTIPHISKKNCSWIGEKNQKVSKRIKNSQTLCAKAGQSYVNTLPQVKTRKPLNKTPEHQFPAPRVLLGWWSSSSQPAVSEWKSFVSEMILMTQSSLLWNQNEKLKAALSSLIIPYTHKQIFINIWNDVRGLIPNLSLPLFGCYLLCYVILCFIGLNVPTIRGGMLWYFNYKISIRFTTLTHKQWIQGADGLLEAVLFFYFHVNH